MEFAIILSILLTIVMGIIDFGHAWFLRQIITNASREGARMGVIYQTPGVSESAIQAAVRNYLHPSGLDTPETKVQVEGAGGASGTRLKVTVISTKTWWIINKFVPGMGDEIQMTAETSMRIE